MDTNITKCIFTGLPTKNVADIPRERDIVYKIETNGKEHFFRFSQSAPIDEWVKNPWFKENRYIFASLIYNNNWIKDEETTITLEVLEQILNEKNYPVTPQQKLENLFLKLFNNSKYDGSQILIGEQFLKNEKWKNYYLKNEEEFMFYCSTLVKQGLIEDRSASNEKFSSYQATYDGLLYSIKLQTDGELSNKCFIAMSFAKGMERTRQIIKDVVTKAGFEPILIDEVHNNSDVTINDAIIARLKQCKFCIADFTNQSRGVYFESGFALGQGKKVIYICHKKDSKKCHFDTKAFQHIFYDYPEELIVKLKDKIDAWIK